MASIIKTCEKTVIIELAEAISKFNIDEVSELLSDNGNFEIQIDKDDIAITNKVNFLDWLRGSSNEFLTGNKSLQRLEYTVIQCLHCVTGNPIIIFSDGNFPLFSNNKEQNEKAAL